MESLGKRIKQLRTLKNITQPQLAQAVGVSNGIISIWENDINEPKASYIKRLAIFFDVTSDYLLGLEDETGEKVYNNYGISYNNSVHNGDNRLK